MTVYLCIRYLLLLSSVYYIFLASFVFFQRLSIFDFSALRPNIIITKRQRRDPLPLHHPGHIVNVLPGGRKLIEGKVCSLAPNMIMAAAARGQFIAFLDSGLIFCVFAKRQMVKGPTFSDTRRSRYRNTRICPEQTLYFDWEALYMVNRKCLFKTMQCRRGGTNRKEIIKLINLDL